MAYTLAVSAVMLAAGLGVERALERLGRPTRWVWLGGMLAGVVVPVGALLRAPLPAAPLPGGSSRVGEIALVGVGALPEPAAAPLALDSALLLGWGAASLLVTLALCWSLASLARTRRGWRRETVERTWVWISEQTGPAVVGFLRPSIVLPAWVLGWDPALRRLIVAHEREHVRAGDSRLLLAGLLLLCAAPWNVALWWQWRRLRQAVETDCDRRVLAAEPDVRRYGSLLLEVAERTRRQALPMAAFAESRSFLERRIRMMTNRQIRHRAGWTAALAVAGLIAPAALLALPAPAPLGVAGVRAFLVPGSGAEPIIPAAMPLAGETRGLARGDTAMLEIVRSPRAIAQRDTIPERGDFTYEVAVLERKPELANKSQVASMLNRYYPRMLKDAGIGGSVTMQYVITPQGAVDPATVKVINATHEQFGEASTQVVKAFRFVPGIYEGKPVRVIIQMPITWEPPTATTGDPAAQASPAGRSGALSTPVLSAIREIVTRTQPGFLGSATGKKQILWVIAHPDGRVERAALAPGRMDPYTLRGSDFDPELTDDQIGHLQVITSSDLSILAKDLDSVIWVTLRS
jgi:TonB family protein